ncbi:hypothetical protein ACFLYG_02135 [Chloroflexota bacterium]
MKIFKKVLPIAVIAAMLMTVFVPATAVADVSNLWIGKDNSTPLATGVQYAVFFTNSVNLIAGDSDTVTVIFPTGTDLTGVTLPDVQIGKQGSSLTPASSIIKPNPLTLVVTVDADVPAGDRTVVLIQNVTNPGAGAKQAQVFTSKETNPVLSSIYNLPGLMEFDGSIYLSDTTAGATGVTYEFNFRLENNLFTGNTVTVTFPLGTDLSSVTAGDCWLNDTTATVDADPGVRTVTFTVDVARKLIRGETYRVSIDNVTNTAPAGSKTLNITNSTNDIGSQNYLITGPPVFVKTPLNGGDDANDGLTWATAKETIGAAVTAASVGSSINVGYGTYQESVMVNKPRLSIFGNYPATGGAPTTTKATVQSPTTDTVFAVTADNVRIQYFTITGATGADQAGVEIDNADNCEIQRCIITGNNWGVFLWGGSTSNGIWASGITSNTEGVHSAGGQNNWVGHCNITGNDEYGIYNEGDWIGADQNWWGNASGPNGPRLDEWGGPNHILPGTGNRVTQRVWCMPWLTRNISTVKADAIAYFGISTRVDQGWNIVSTPLALDGYVQEDNTGGNYAASTWGGLWDLGKRETFSSGSHTGSNDAALLTDAGASWTADELINLKIYNTTDGSYGNVTDNTDTTVTVVLSGGTENDWDTNDEYRIEDGHALKLYYEVVPNVGREYADIWYWDSDIEIWVQVTANTVVNPIDAYYVRMKEADSIPILFSPDKSVPGKYLYAGWNLVGYSYMPLGGPGRGESLSASIEIALKTIEKVSSVSGDVKGYAQVVSPPMNQFPWVYIPPAEGGAGGTFVAPEFHGPEGEEAKECVMVVGRGYWVFMANPGYLAGLTFTPMSTGPDEW